MLPEECVVLDLETTGLSPTKHRIIEVGFLEIQSGDVVDQWSSLVNPGTPISPFITQHTGISNELVADAPTFAEIAENLYQRLKGRVLIAHNARFDYGFLKNEFRRLGSAYQEKTLCTLKLSRRLFPAERRHGLDSLVKRHGLTLQERHRALGDAQMTWQFLEKVLADFPDEVLRPVLIRLLGQPSVPPHLPAEQLDALPESPGVYLFYGDRDQLLYVGKSIDLRSRVMSHFSGDHASHKDMRLAQQVHRLDFIETAGELGALLLEARLVKDRSPIHNRRLRRTNTLYSLCLKGESKEKVEVISLSGNAPKKDEELYGLFRSKRQAAETLRKLAAEQKLCLRVLGLEKGEGACFAFQLKKCCGACVGREPLNVHGLRLQLALSNLKIRTWPYAGPIGIREDSPAGFSEIHVIDQWRYLGTAADDQELREILETRGKVLPFDLDSYKILCRFMAKWEGEIEDLA